MISVHKWTRCYNGILLIALYNGYSSSISDTSHSQCSHHEFNCALNFCFFNFLIFVWMLRNVHTQQYIIGWHYDPATSASFWMLCFSKRCPASLPEMIQNYDLNYFCIVQAIHDVNISAKSTFVSVKNVIGFWKAVFFAAWNHHHWLLIPVRQSRQWNHKYTFLLAFC